jgi:two-component system sensor histidine kinase DesK
MVFYRVSVWSMGVVWQLDRARQAQALLAVAEERLRFARDLHDVLGRNLALIAVNSELAGQLLRRGQHGAAGQLQQIHQIAQDSMREMREIVGGYRTADLDCELAGARSVLRSAGIDTQVIGAAAALPGPVQTALGWVVREAITNIIRHSDPTTVRIELDVPADTTGEPAAVLRIENDGAHPIGPDTPNTGIGPPGGHGLVGLGERLAGLGGVVTAHALPGGRFLLQAHLPLTRPRVAAAAAGRPVS